VGGPEVVVLMRLGLLPNTGCAVAVAFSIRVSLLRFQQ